MNIRKHSQQSIKNARQLRKSIEHRLKATEKEIKLTQKIRRILQKRVDRYIRDASPLKSPTWKTSAGDVLLISKMEDIHLTNAIGHLFKVAKTLGDPDVVDITKLGELIREALKRNIWISDYKPKLVVSDIPSRVLTF